MTPARLSRSFKTRAPAIRLRIAATAVVDKGEETRRSGGFLTPVEIADEAILAPPSALTHRSCGITPRRGANFERVRFRLAQPDKTEVPLQPKSQAQTPGSSQL